MKHCKACGAELHRREREDTRDWLARVTCGRACARRLPKGGPRYILEDRGHDSPCWVWQKALTDGGYGQVRVDKTLWAAHRWFYVQAKGEIPNGLVLDHLCRVRSCVNPEHLEAVTQAENTRRGERVLLTEDDVRAIRASSLGCRRLAQRFGVARETILAVRQGRSWKGVA